MSSIVDSRPQADETMCPRGGDAGLFDSLVKGRFVALAAVVMAALALGFGSGGGDESRKTAVGEMPGLRLDPNTVPPQVLTALPHVGSSLVDRWVKAREERPFRSLDDARERVRGLGAATAEQIAPFVEFPEVRRQDSKSVASRGAARPTAKPRTASRKKSSPTGTTATQPSRLASRPLRPSDQ
jgi:hypothetical protein